MKNKEEIQIEQYKIIHKNDPNYGASSVEFLEEVCLVIDYLKPKTILDYGCGKGALLKKLSRRYPEIAFYGYDPAIEGRDVLPIKKADLIINTDVLEHIKEDTLPSVIEKISKISQKVYFNLHHALATAVLPNGENAHCTVKPPEWYHKLFKNYFKTITPLPGKKNYLSVVLTFKIPSSLKASYFKTIGAKIPQKRSKLSLTLDLCGLKILMAILPPKKQKRIKQKFYILQNNL